MDLSGPLRGRQLARTRLGPRIGLSYVFEDSCLLLQVVDGLFVCFREFCHYAGLPFVF